MFGGEHAGPNCLMRAFDFRHIEQSGTVADQQRARHFAIRQRLITAFDECASTGRNDLSAIKQRLDSGVILELLKRFPRLEFRVGVVETGDKTDGDAIFVEVVDETAAIGCVVQWPAQRMHDFAGLNAALRQLPKFLDADAVGLRIGVLVEVVFGDELFAQAAATTFGQHGDRRFYVDALGIAGFMRAIFGHAHVADAHAGDATVFVEQRFAGGKTGVDFHAQRFGLRCEPRAQRAQ